MEREDRVLADLRLLEEAWLKLTEQGGIPPGEVIVGQGFMLAVGELAALNTTMGEVDKHLHGIESALTRMYTEMLRK